MIHRPYTQVLLDDPAMRLALIARAPANEIRRPLDREIEPQPAGDEGWLRWLKVCFGCETG
jgi:hypothetical protein